MSVHIGIFTKFFLVILLLHKRNKGNIFFLNTWLNLYHYRAKAVLIVLRLKKCLLFLENIWRSNNITKQSWFCYRTSVRFSTGMFGPRVLNRSGSRTVIGVWCITYRRPTFTLFGYQYETPVIFQTLSPLINLVLLIYLVWKQVSFVVIPVRVTLSCVINKVLW